LQGNLPTIILYANVRTQKVNLKELYCYIYDCFGCLLDHLKLLTEYVHLKHSFIIVYGKMKATEYIVKFQNILRRAL